MFPTFLAVFEVMVASDPVAMIRFETSSWDMECSLGGEVGDYRYKPSVFAVPVRIDSPVRNELHVPDSAFDESRGDHVPERPPSFRQRAYGFAARTPVLCDVEDRCDDLSHLS